MPWSGGFWQNVIIERVIWKIAAILLAVTLHEVAHGYAAFRLGDPTAKAMGRLTLNPVRHLDVLGSVILPLFLILTHYPVLLGWAKPVPVNFHNLRNFRRDAMVVSVAGVAVNLACALAAGFCIQGLITFAETASVSGKFAEYLLVQALLFLGYFLMINAVLAVFNLFPVPPLDGGRLLVLALPPEWGRKFERMQPVTLVIFMILLFLGKLDVVLRFFIEPILRISLGADFGTFLPFWQ